MNPRNALNFSGGPGALPETVLQQLSEALIREPVTGLSVLGISHRSKWFAEVVDELEANILGLLGIQRGYQVLFLQGGATQQFSMIPMTLLRGVSAPAEYLQTGYWSQKAIPEARREGPVRVLWNGQPEQYQRLPQAYELASAPDAPYLHYASNETVEGMQFQYVPGLDSVPRICDMSSDFLSRPCPAERYALIYAHAQKNIGPAGVTVVLLRDEIIERVPDNLPGFLDYRAQANARSNFNTPPVFAIYTMLLVTRWLKQDIGSLSAMDQINQQKAQRVYAQLDASNGFYRGRARREDRSLMNVSFNLATPELEQQFLRSAEAAGLSGLGGHRSVGGLRASLYNAVTLAAVDTLVSFMADFAHQHRHAAPG
ncbi:phosphoserine transaminase [Amantichitinum ursilacus]|uniref:Phosphoserine aminotransferase n=1 Tax=Amantichitinum ursilacus TaxID=857265 RepID=A0A0N0GPY0_9NEIS|nr:phosphoserine transaminase [Amantichitinum ursilacus]KPC54224.1 Phosphoserine aminotransferase [Amantichitinum ursilacus]